MMAAPDMPVGEEADQLSDALAALRSGRPTLIIGQGPGGDVVLPAAMATPRWTSWMVRHTSGLLCAPLPADRADRLDLPPMVKSTSDGPTYAVTVDARHGVSTGISAADRARTATVLADPDARPADLTRPGHLLPLRTRPGGVLERAAPAEAAVDLCRFGGLPRVALTATIVADDGATADAAAVAELARRNDLPVLNLAQIVHHRLYNGDGENPRVRRVVQTRLPTPQGVVRAIGYRDEVTGAEHLAVLGAPAPGSVPIVHVHTECLAGELFRSLRCDCRRQLDNALARINAEGGAVVYLRRVKHLDGLETHTAPPCDHGAAAAVLTDLNMTTIRLLPGSATAAGLRLGGVTAVGIRTAEQVPSIEERI
jgi:3,4-dihydroxy 2-butanone 4-phosphate synthase/GTP cyclohydrolase II